MCIRLPVSAELGYWAALKRWSVESKRGSISTELSLLLCWIRTFFRNRWIISNIMKLPWEGAFSILLTTVPSTVLPVRECYLWESVKERKQFLYLSACLPPSPWGASLKFECVQVCTHSHVSPQDPVGSPPTQRVMNVGPLAATIKSKPLWFSIEPALPASFTSLYGRPHWVQKTGTPMAHWAASVPPTSTQSHKAVPHHQMWWSPVLILVWSLNSSADTVWNTHFTVVLWVRRRRWGFAATL